MLGRALQRQFLDGRAATRLVLLVHEDHRLAVLHRRLHLPQAVARVEVALTRGELNDEMLQKSVVCRGCAARHACLHLTQEDNDRRAVLNVRLEHADVRQVVHIEEDADAGEQMPELPLDHRAPVRKDTCGSVRRVAARILLVVTAHWSCPEDHTCERNAW